MAVKMAQQCYLLKSIIQCCLNVLLIPQNFKEFCPDEQFVKNTQCLDISAWDPSYTKTQVDSTCAQEY